MISASDISQNNIVILVHKVGVGMETNEQVRKRLSDYNTSLHQENRVFDNFYIKHYLIPTREVPIGEIDVKCVYPSREIKTLPEDLWQTIKESIKFTDSE